MAPDSAGFGDVSTMEVAGRPDDGPPAAPHAERLEFVRAFIDHARAHPSPDRLVVRPHIALLVASTTLIGAVLFGLVMGLFTSEKAGATGTEQPSGTPGPTSYTAVTGWDCRSANDHMFEARGRTAQWATLASGAWTQDGCSGAFTAVPMSGDTSTDDPSQSLIWAFTPGTGVNRCAVSVYAPKLTGNQITPAGKAHFLVTGGRDGTSYGTFDLNQAAKSGDWLEAGAFPISNGKFTVRLSTAGKPASAKERLIVSQVRVACGLADK